MGQSYPKCNFRQANTQVMSADTRRSPTCSFLDHDAVETKIYFRDDLQIGTPISGPAIIQQYDTTTVLPPGWVGTQEASGNLVLRKKAAS